MKKVLSISLLILVVCPSLIIAGDPLEYQLAVIDSGGYVSKSDIKVARFRSLLSQLSNKFVENKQQISDMTVAAQNRLRDCGVKESLLNMMEGMNKLFFQRNSGLKYAEYIAAYITCRRQGMSHSETIDGLQGILESFGVQ